MHHYITQFHYVMKTDDTEEDFQELLFLIGPITFLDIFNRLVSRELTGSFGQRCKYDSHPPKVNFLLLRPHAMHYLCNVLTVTLKIKFECKLLCCVWHSFYVGVNM